jgi:hypothetical protein
MMHSSEDKPSTSRDFWVYYDGIDESKHSVNSDGKWMLFYPKEELDERWVDACNHFDAGHFQRVCAMKVSTLRRNPRAPDPKKGVIILHTPRMSDEEQKKTGYAIMSAMGYAEKMFLQDRRTNLCRYFYHRPGQKFDLVHLPTHRHPRRFYH